MKSDEPCCAAGSKMAVKRMRHALSSVTLEPVVVAMALSQGILMIASQCLYIEKVLKCNQAT